MKFKAKRTEYIDVDIDPEQFLKHLSHILAKTYDFDPYHEYIHPTSKYICSDVKYHTWDIFEKRPATDQDIEIQKIFYAIRNFLI